MVTVTPGPPVCSFYTSEADCSFHVLWAKGRGVAMDWLPRERRLCELYHALLVEDVELTG